MNLLIMRSFLNDFGLFIKSLKVMDIIFLLGIIGAIVLIVSLLYIIKINDQENIEVIDEDKEKSIDMPQIESTIEIIEDNKEDELDLSEISKELESSSPKAVALNDYEKEQEEKAIISYDELLKTKDLKEDINYINEQNIGGLTVKSVDSKEMTKTIEIPKIMQTSIFDNDDIKIESKNNLISYDKEEEFLDTLKKLDKNEK